MKRRIIISTDDCYEGRDINEDCLMISTYSDLYDNPEIDNDSIEWSSDAWRDELDYFNDILKFEKEKFEKRYRTEVLELVLCGKMGLWNGSPVGGKLVNFKNPISMGNVDSIDVTIEDDRTIIISGHHHDGTHHMCLYFLTASAMKRAGIFNTYENSGANYFDAYDYEAIYENLNPIKLSKNNIHCSYC